MELKITYEDTKFKKEDKELIHNFIKLLQEKYPLRKEITVKFLGKQIGKMSTGSRTDNGELKILANNRLNRDIMRTLAHEWVHEHQMSVQGRKKGPNIGGKNEDEANAFAGRLVKMFEKKHPYLEKKMYESNSIKNKLNLISEQIVLNEKETIKENLIVEMKKVGIEKLPYSYSSLNKFIDSKTMDVHYNKHYKGYVDKLNKAIKNIKGDVELEDIIKSISKYDNAIRNNAGGAFNHALFWKMLSPKKQVPTGEIYKQIKKDFGNIKKMKDEFNQVAKDRFGSGWAWLYLTKDGNLKIMSLPNQDNPLMNVVKKGGFPLLGLDVWEHAYYLKYQNKRDEYINNFWNVVNWKFVNELYELKTKKKNIKENISEKFLLKEYNNQTQLGIKSNDLLKIVLSNYSECTNRKNPNGCIGKIQDDKCTTSQGIIGGKYTEGNYGGVGNWSIVNRFDTNSLVHNEINKIYNESGSNVSLSKWVISNKKNLFSNNGVWTDRLVNLNKGTIEKGRINENYAKEKIKESFSLKPEEEGMTWTIIDRCAGDIRDRKYGQDLDVIINETSYFFQVKPMLNFKDIKKLTDERGNYYKVPSYNSQNKYKQDKVDVIMYVNEPNNQYIMFRNDYSKIITTSNPNSYNKKLPKYLIFYYEEPIKTNATFDTEEKINNIQLKPKLLRNNQEEIKYLTDKIKMLSQKVKELGGSVDIEGLLEQYKNELIKISF